MTMQVESVSERTQQKLMPRRSPGDGTLPTEGDQHRFRESYDDPLHCLHCGGYPFDFVHWCTG